MGRGAVAIAAAMGARPLYLPEAKRAAGAVVGGRTAELQAHLAVAGSAGLRAERHLRGRQPT